MDNGRRDGGVNMRTILKRLQAVDFSIVETVLYLDAYPKNKAALAYYHKLLEERRRLTDALHQSGAPTTAGDNVSTEQWDWVKGPWPWEIDANS